MTCIIIDDEPLAREAIAMLIEQTAGLTLIGSFNSPQAAEMFLAQNTVELILLDIQMPGISGIEFARTIPKNTLVVFTTAYAEFAIDSYEVDALDYLLKPIRLERFQKAIEKAQAYLNLLDTSPMESAIERVEKDFFFVKADRRIFKINFEDILFIQGLKDYVVIHTHEQKVITAMNIKTIHEQLPNQLFVRVSKSYIINVKHIESVDNNTVYIDQHEIPIGNIYRDHFFHTFVLKKILSR